MATDTLSTRVAEEVRAMLARKGMNKSELGRRLGVSHTWVTNRLAGHQEIGINELDRIADALGVPVSALLPATVRPNDRSAASPVRAPKTTRATPTRPKGRPGNASTRPQSSGPPTRRRPARIDRPTSR